MIKKLILLPVLMVQLLCAQPVINNAGNFTIGTVLKFKPCATNTLYAGSGGANRVWNFISLDPTTDTLTTTIVSPASTTAGSLFPNAAFAERNSDHTTSYINQSQGLSYLAGFIDSTSSYPIKMVYQDPVQTQQNPITYTTSVTDNFALTYTLEAISHTVKGGGTSTLEGDGYGTLILPNGSYQNVLRVKITLQEADTLVETGNTFSSTTVSWLFFDGVHASSLLTIDSTQNTTGPALKKVKFLMQENNTALGIRELKQAVTFKYYPNPADNYVTLTCKEAGLLKISNALGQTQKYLSIDAGEKTIALQDLEPGIYFLELETASGRSTSKLLIH